jgi:hypothetical protein
VWVPASTPLELVNLDRDVYVKATLSTTEPEFATRTPIALHAVGSIGTKSVGGTGFEKNASALKDILTVCLTFSGAHSVVGNQVITNAPAQPTDGAVCLGITNTKPKEDLLWEFGQAGAYLAADTSTIEWLNPTESVPSIVIVYWGVVVINGVPQMTSNYRDPKQSVQVESDATVKSNKVFLKSSVIEIAGVGLGVLNAILLGISKLKQPKSKRESKPKVKLPKRPSQARAKSRR